MSQQSRTVTVAAVDLGASSGRVMVARLGPDLLQLEEVHRFPNLPVEVSGTLHTDVLGLYRGVLEGLRAAGRSAHQHAVGRLDAIGIDSWAVDHGLLDADGALLGNPVHYRDGRTDGVMDKAFANLVSSAEVYATTGIQNLPFNTAWQLLAAQGTAQMDAAERMLLIPDLLAYWLTGVQVAEVTNASTTQLLDVHRRAWADDLIAALGIDRGVFPELVEPGSVIGQVTDGLADQLGLTRPVPVIAVGSHDTASAFVGVPASGNAFATISCGTWSLVGIELSAPVLTEDSRQANFTNELGVDGTVRYLRNVMGLWLLQQSIATWNTGGLPADLETLLADAARVPRFTALVDPDDQRFLPPGDMPGRIAAVCRGRGQDPPQSQAETVRCILDSLALAYRRTVRKAVELSGHAVEVVHIVGGGARNALLCQLTADATGLPVLAGPVEAAALGNALVQARALGAAPTDLNGLRNLLGRTQAVTRYEPSAGEAAWAAAERRVFW
ncbi:rhamnulokinase family protein [soil metagenome]